MAVTVFFATDPHVAPDPFVGAVLVSDCLVLAAGFGALQHWMLQVTAYQWGLDFHSVFWRRQLPWHEIKRVDRSIAASPVLVLDKLPALSPSGLGTPARLFLERRMEVTVQLRALRDSRPIDAWPEPARKIFEYYCGPAKQE